MLNRSLNHTDISVESLWDGLKSGNKDDFEALYQLYFDDLYRYGMVILPDVYLVEDAIHDLFINLWQNREKLSEPNQVKYYLLRSLRSRIYDVIDKQKKSRKSALAFKEEHIRLIPSKEEEIIRNDNRGKRTENVKILVNDLPERQREAVMLIFFDNKTYDEAALIMSMDVKSLYTLVWRAMSSLRKDSKNFM